MNTAPGIRVFCVDDHPLMREGIAAVIRNESDKVPDLIVRDVGVYVSVILKYRVAAFDEDERPIPLRKLFGVCDRWKKKPAEQFN